MNLQNWVAILIAVCCVFAESVPGQDFVNWESPHVSPLDLTPNGEQLLAVNTADNRLEVIDVEDRTVLKSIRVGLDPVSVRALSNTQAWVVNHISDSVSVVDLAAGRVIKTLYPGDEPCDVVFAGQPLRAFVSASQENRLAVFDPANLSVAPQYVDIQGEDPRALATDGTSVFAAIFVSGNRTTSLSEFVVSFAGWNPYPGAPNPPPNNGNGFLPPIATDLPVPPKVSMIVKRNEVGEWFDDNGGDWSNAVGHDVHDHDVAIVDANSFSVSYATGLMNANMSIAVTPGGGAVVVGTDSINEVRFEPNLRSQFVRVKAAAIENDGSVLGVFDMNPHIDYSQTSVPVAERKMSLGDPRGTAWSPDASEFVVAGMGSNNIVIHNSSLIRTGRVEVGQGPTGVQIDGQNIYVLNKFDASVSVVARTSLAVIDSIELFDPTPIAIREGRPFLYNTHLTSGLGQAACASCHIDGRMDHLAWDLGNPQGEMKVFNQTKLDFPGTDVEDWHPMKGPMSTQTLFGLDHSAPFHWRGDREDIAAFNPAFVDLQGADSLFSQSDLSKFESFVMTLAFPPNPNRNVDGTLPTTFGNGGNPELGQQLFRTGQLDAPFECVDCHSGTTGTDQKITPQVLDQQTQSMKAPQLRNLFEKVGRDDSQTDNNLGFGFVHDGSFDTLFNFLGFGFDFQNDQQKMDVAAYLLCFSTDTFAAVGTQVTVPSNVPGARVNVADLMAMASSGKIEIVASGIYESESRGFAWLNGTQFQTDRLGEVVSLDQLLNDAVIGSETTFTAVPIGSSERIALDRDSDGYFDGDELDGGSDPADSDSVPVIVPASFNVTRGSLAFGSAANLAESDNYDVSIRRSNSDVQSRITFEVVATSPVTDPTSMQLTLEGSVFARSGVNQIIELFDYENETWERLDSRPARRFTDEVVNVALNNNLSRFVGQDSAQIKARVRFVSSNPRQRFTSNTDEFSWLIK